MKSSDPPEQKDFTDESQLKPWIVYIKVEIVLRYMHLPKTNLPKFQYPCIKDNSESRICTERWTSEFLMFFLRSGNFYSKMHFYNNSNCEMLIQQYSIFPKDVLKLFFVQSWRMGARNGHVPLILSPRFPNSYLNKPNCNVFSAKTAYTVLLLVFHFLYRYRYFSFQLFLCFGNYDMSLALILFPFFVLQRLLLFFIWALGILSSFCNLLTFGTFVPAQSTHTDPKIPRDGKVVVGRLVPLFALFILNNQFFLQIDEE